jgi:hypothetical protein
LAPAQLPADKLPHTAAACAEISEARVTEFFWVVWGLLTLLAYGGGWLVGVAVYANDASSSRRLVVPFLVAPTMILLSMQACALFHAMDRAALTPFCLVFFSSVAIVSFRYAGRSAVLRCLRADALAPWRVVKSIWVDREPLGLATFIALGLWSVACVMCVAYRSWMFDPLWYHVTITDYAVQNHDLDWIPTHLHYVSGYPRNVELLAAWNCLFPLDNLLDDAPQIPFALLGMLSIAAWCRRFDASRAVSAGVAAVWYALPPVFLLTPSSYTDLATGALLIATAFFISDPLGRASRWFAFLGIGLYIGAKFTGFFHLGFVGPVLFVRAIIELVRLPNARERMKRAADIVLSFALFCSVSIWKYVQNWENTKNPFFPLKTRVPFTHVTFDGPEDLQTLLQIQPDKDGNFYFFAAPDEFRHFVNAWLDPKVAYTPEVHGGGFGPVFLWFLLPCIFVVFADALRKKKSSDGIVLMVLFVASLGVPKAWWPRFAMGAPAAAVIAFAWVHKDVRSKILKGLFSLALLTATYSTTKTSFSGWNDVFPSHWQEALRATHTERAALRLGAHWRYEDSLEKEFELRAGDVVTYDEGSTFLSNFFVHDFRTRVEFVSSAGDPQLYLQRLRSLHVMWAGVQKDTPAEAAVAQSGAQKLFNIEGTNENVYRMPSP